MSLIIVNEDSLDVSRPSSLLSLTSFVVTWTGFLLECMWEGIGYVGGYEQVTVGTRVCSAGRWVGGALCVLTGSGN